MMQMAEDVLGIPLFIVQEDLPSSLPNINLALLTCVVCIRNSIDIKPGKLFADFLLFRNSCIISFA